MAALNKFPYSQAPYRKVERVQFSIMSPDEIKTMSVVKVEHPQTFESGRPKAGGLGDQRMGTLSRDFKCQTCESDSVECPGHFGHIELAKPVFHIGFMDQVIRVLRSVCMSCSKLKCYKHDNKFKAALKLPPPDRLNAVYQLAKDWKVCVVDDPNKEHIKKDPNYVQRPHNGCGNEQPTLKRAGYKIVAEYKNPQVSAEAKRELTAEDVYEIFKNISDDDVLAMGLDAEYARPDWMIVTVMAVPPPPVRPSVIVGSSSRGEDDLTYKLADIVKVNNQLHKHHESASPPHIIKEFTQMLQYHVATFYNNELPDQPRATQKTGRALKTIYQRLKGKEGRVRGNLMGKRVDFSGRSVITGDPLISCEQVGVPSTIAKRLTFPELVTPFNLREMQELVARGPDELPGALYVVRENGVRDDLRFVKNRNDIHLSYGDRVERHLRDGDYVIFNRQPSLHKMSMMGHRVKIFPYSTFRLNLSCTTPYNADFDGDEMNLHAPQNVETRAEISEIMLVPRQIVSPQKNAPVIGLVQDTLLGSSLFSRRDVFLERYQVMNLMMWLPQFNGKLPVPAILKPQELWTGKQIFSMWIPPVTISANAKIHPKEFKDEWKFFSPMDSEVIIDQGTHISGILDSNVLARTQGGIIHLTWNDFGHEAARDFIDQSQRVVNHWLVGRGFTIGIGDTIADKPTMVQINNEISKAKDAVSETIKELHDNKLEIKPGMTLNESFESKVNHTLNSAREKTGEFAQVSLPRSNNIRMMINGGSKGSFINIAQMVACVGQQNVEGKRIPFGFRQRTLPHFNKNDQSPQSRGFVENSYLRGLTPQEFFFHAMGGREGVIDTAVKTAQTGYVQRRLVKAMEDVVVQYDATTRNSQGEVIQFLYGEDGMDGLHMEGQVLESFLLNDKDFNNRYKYDFTHPTLGLAENALEPSIVEQINADPAKQAILEEEFRSLTEDRRMLRADIFPGRDDPKWPLPVNIRRFLVNCVKQFRISDKVPTALSPLEVVQKVKWLCARLFVIKGEDAISIEAQRNGTMLFCIHLRAILASKRVINEMRLTPQSFFWLVGEIEGRFLKSLVSPGESVGAIAAQSIGEPTTQMTLNTFHHAGVSAKNVTLGVPRLTELINVAKQIKTPSMTVYLPPNMRTDQEKAKTLIRELEYTTLERILSKTEIWFDPDVHNTVINEDHEFLEMNYDALPEEDANVEKEISKWVLRLEFNKNIITDKKLTMQKIADKIQNYFTNIYCVSSDDNAPTLVMHVRLRDKDRAGPDGEAKFHDTDDFQTLQQVEQVLLTDVPLGGIHGVTRIFTTSPIMLEIKPDGGFNKSNKENALDTEGSNLLQTLSHPMVDSTRTTCNDVVETLMTLGIEAAREALFVEIKKVISFDGAYVNYRHLAMLCDLMTYRGHLLAVSRHGINRRGTGPLMRCSFEETVDMLTEAAAFAEVDNLKGVSENLVLGNLAPLGTAAFELMLNSEMLKDAVEVPTEQYFGGPGSGSDVLYSPHHNPYIDPPRAYTPVHMTPGGYLSPTGSPAASPSASPGGGGYSPSSPGYSPASPGFSPTSPGYSPASPGYSPASPAYSPASPGYSPASPSYSPASPSYSPASPSYSPTSPRYSPTSPSYSPTSPRYSPASPSYSPTSPRYSPTSPQYSPTSPKYSPTSPKYSPSSPQYSPSSPKYSPSSPKYSPSSPKYSPSSPQYSPSSPKYSPSSPQYSPSSPQYSPSSPQYSPSSPQYSPSSPQYSPSSPQYSPASPQYSPPQPGQPPQPPPYPFSQSFSRFFQINL